MRSAKNDVARFLSSMNWSVNSEDMYAALIVAWSNLLIVAIFNEFLPSKLWFRAKSKARSSGNMICAQHQLSSGKIQSFCQILINSSFLPNILSNYLIVILDTLQIMCFQKSWCLLFVFKTSSKNQFYRSTALLQWFFLQERRSSTDSFLNETTKKKFDRQFWDWAAVSQARSAGVYPPRKPVLGVGQYQTRHQYWFYPDRNYAIRV